MARGRPRSSNRQFVENIPSVDVAQLQPPFLFDGSIPQNPQERLKAANWATYTVTWPDGRSNREIVALRTSRTGGGGVRYWLRCPGCGKRAGKLYAANSDGRLICRKCAGLAYRCQYRKARSGHDSLIKLLKRFGFQM